MKILAVVMLAGVGYGAPISIVEPEIIQEIEEVMEAAAW